MLLLFIFLSFFNSLLSSDFHLGLFRVSSNPVEEKVSAFTSKLFSMGPSQYSAWYWSALCNHQLYSKSSIFKYSANYSVIYLFLFSSFHVVFLPELSVPLFSFSSQVFRFQRTCGDFGCGLLFLFFYWANFLVIVFSVFLPCRISCANLLFLILLFIFFTFSFIFIFLSVFSFRSLIVLKIYFCFVLSLKYMSLSRPNETTQRLKLCSIVP